MEKPNICAPDNIPEINANSNAVDKIAWLGIDGLLVLSYFVIVGIGLCSLVFRIDVLTAYIFPFILLCIVLFVFINYMRTLGSFLKAQRKQ